MMFQRFSCVLPILIACVCAPTARAQIGKANQILINRGLQIEALSVPYDTFHVSTCSNANYTAVLWTWDSPRSYNNMSGLMGSPGFPWGRWASDETDMPPLGQEASYMGQLGHLQLADEWNLNDDPTRTRAVNWFTSVAGNWPNTILAANNWGGQISDGNLIDFVSRAHPDMICFDTYPWQNVWDGTVSNHIGAVILGPPTSWYTFLRIYRDISRSFNIPFGNYVQTFHAVQDYNTTVYRDPSPSELRLNHSGALAFNSKMLIDFLYNNGSSSLFIPPGGDSNPSPLYSEKADAALRARNLGKALVRLKPIDEATASWTTSIMFVRGKDSNGNLNPIPVNFYAGPGGTNPNTDWVADRNDTYLRGWVVTNTGTKNNGQPGDVIIAWFKPLDEIFDGPMFTNESYFMVVNGLTDPTGTAADCSQQIKLNFLDNFTDIQMLNPETGNLDTQTLPVVSTRRQLTLNLNGGDAALFKISDGAPFIGVPTTDAPVITVQPASRTNVIGSTANFGVAASGDLPLTYTWLFNGNTIPGATSYGYDRTNVQNADAGNYSVIISNSFGSVTSSVATLTVTASGLMLYEPFDYPNIGAPVSSNTPANWAYGGAGANDLNVSGGNLWYPGLAQPVGNSVTNGGAGLGVRRLLGASANSGVLYFSALFRMNDLGFGTWNGTASQVGALTANDSTSFRLQVMVKSNSASGYVVGVQKGGTGATATFDTTERHAGDILFLVGKYDFTVSPNAVSLWINASPSSFGAGSPPPGAISGTTGTDGFTIDRFNIRQNTAPSVPAAMQWDELRVGNSWDAVTLAGPPPTIKLSNATWLGDGRFQFAYTNAYGFTGTVFGSTNLVDWSAAGIAAQIGPGLYQFIDANASNYTQRFYQVRWP
jgi:hypothetical protein